LLDGVDDLVVAGASAGVASEVFAYRCSITVRICCGQLGNAHEETRRAESTLQSMTILEGLLDRMEWFVVVGQRLDRVDSASVDLDCERQARAGRLSVDVDRARTAIPVLASDVGARESEIMAKKVAQEDSGVD
jgi:hypothetical protein